MRPLDALYGGRFRVAYRIGNGRFAEVQAGEDLETGQPVAVKLEHTAADVPLLRHESKLYRTLAGGPGIPDLHWFGVHGDHHVMVIDLLGPSLEEMLEFCRRQINIKTVLILADQLIRIIQYIHSRNIIHRDIKPANLLLGLGGQADDVHIIDFGLAKAYRDAKTRRHIPYYASWDNTLVLDTGLFSSVGMHLGREQARQDDLESIGHTLMYLLEGRLPWQDVLEVELIGDAKVSTPLDVLCAGLPDVFIKYLVYCRRLRFGAAPDYMYLRNLFKELFLVHGLQDDGIFDWTRRGYSKSESSKRQVLPKHGSTNNKPCILPPQGMAEQSNGLRLPPISQETSGVRLPPITQQPVPRATSPSGGLKKHYPRAAQRRAAGRDEFQPMRPADTQLPHVQLDFSQMSFEEFMNS